MASRKRRYLAPLRSNVPTKKKKIQHEQFEQQTLVQWFRLQYPRLKYHLSASANGGKRTPKEGARLKKMGVLAGEADLFLSLINQHSIDGQPYLYAGLFIELKSKKGKLSKHQEELLNSRRLAGYLVSLSYSWEEAKDDIQEYMKGAIMPYLMASELQSLDRQQPVHEVSNCVLDSQADIPGEGSTVVEASHELQPQILTPVLTERPRRKKLSIVKT